MASEINLTSAQLSRLATIARDALPNESCAFLLGSAEKSSVAEVLPMTNADRSPYSFSIEPSELLRAYDEAEKNGLQVIGIYHSHPGKSSPSATDRKYMELNPVVWLIYSTTEERFSAFISDGGVDKVELNIRD